MPQAIRLRGVKRAQPTMRPSTFKRIRVRVLGVTQEKLAEEMGLQVLQISRLENGHSAILPKHIRMLELLTEKYKKTQEDVSAMLTQAMFTSTSAKAG